MRACFAIIVLAASAGCARVPAEQVSDVDVCRYTLYGSASNKLVAERQARVRSLDCRALYPAIISREQQRNEALRNASNYFNRGASPAPSGGPGFLKRSYVSGFNTICVYDRMGSDYVTTIAGPAAMCPLSPP